jgi:pimeloyl-ACP methyl ester carboxylesterase
MTVRFRVSDSLELAADVEGDWSGQPLLLLHGGGQTRHAWGYTMNALGEAGFLAISLDLRGHGYSDWAPDGNYSIDAYANAFRQVVPTEYIDVQQAGHMVAGDRNDAFTSAVLSFLSRKLSKTRL